MPLKNKIVRNMKNKMESQKLEFNKSSLLMEESKTFNNSKVLENENI